MKPNQMSMESLAGLIVSVGKGVTVSTMSEIEDLTAAAGSTVEPEMLICMSASLGFLSGLSAADQIMQVSGRPMSDILAAAEAVAHQMGMSPAVKLRMKEVPDGGPKVDPSKN